MSEMTSFGSNPSFALSVDLVLLSIDNAFFSKHYQRLTYWYSIDASLFFLWVRTKRVVLKQNFLEHFGFFCSPSLPSLFWFGSQSKWGLYSLKDICHHEARKALHLNRPSGFSAQSLFSQIFCWAIAGEWRLMLNESDQARLHSSPLHFWQHVTKQWCQFFSTWGSCWFYDLLCHISSSMKMMHFFFLQDSLSCLFAT